MSTRTPNYVSPPVMKAIWGPSRVDSLEVQFLYPDGKRGASMRSPFNYLSSSLFT